MNKSAPDAAPVAWSKCTATSLLHLSAISLGEIRYGIELLPPARRRARLAAWLQEELPGRFGGRILPVDAAVADAAGRLAAACRRRGVMMDKADAWIAATAVTHMLTLVTRSEDDFRAAGVPLLNPFR